MYKKILIKIPNDIKIFYSVKKCLIIFIGFFKKKLFILKTKILILIKKKCILFSKLSFSKISNFRKKQLNCLQKTLIVKIKQIILEISQLLHNKLKFIGLGFRNFILNIHKSNILKLNLGFSHPIFFKISSKLKVTSIKTINLFIFGNSYSYINQICTIIRLFKKPNVYKAKGIFYQNEKIILKKGKKA